MTYDEQLAQRLSSLTQKRQDMHEQKMFGGVGYLLRGNMCFGIYKEFLILRLGLEKAAKVLTQKNVKPFDITGRVMKGWVMISPDGFKTGAQLKKWIDLAVEFVSTLPRK